MWGCENSVVISTSVIIEVITACIHKSALYEMKMGSVPFGLHNVTDQGKSCDSDATCGRMCRDSKDCKVAVYSPAGSKCLLTCAPPNFGYKVSGGSIFIYTLII